MEMTINDHASYIAYVRSGCTSTYCMTPVIRPLKGRHAIKASEAGSLAVSSMRVESLLGYNVSANLKSAHRSARVVARRCEGGWAVLSDRRRQPKQRAISALLTSQEKDTMVDKVGFATSNRGAVNGGTLLEQRAAAPLVLASFARTSCGCEERLKLPGDEENVENKVCAQRKWNAQFERRTSGAVIGKGEGWWWPLTLVGPLTLGHETTMRQMGHQDAASGLLTRCWGFRV